MPTHFDAVVQLLYNRLMMQKTLLSNPLVLAAVLFKHISWHFLQEPVAQLRRLCLRIGRQIYKVTHKGKK